MNIADIKQLSPPKYATIIKAKGTTRRIPKTSSTAHRVKKERLIANIFVLSLAYSKGKCDNGCDYHS